MQSGCWSCDGQTVSRCRPRSPASTGGARSVPISERESIWLGARPSYDSSHSRIFKVSGVLIKLQQKGKVDGNIFVDPGVRVLIRGDSQIGEGDLCA